MLTKLRSFLHLRRFIVLGFRYLGVLLLSTFFLAGCTSPSTTTTEIQQPSPTRTPAPPTATPTPTVTPTITPTPTPTLPEMYTYSYAGPVPDGAIRRIGKGDYFGYALSPDGSTIAVASGIGIYLYSAQTFQLLDFYEIGRVSFILYSPNGSNLIAYIPSTFSLKFIDPRDGSVIRTIQLRQGVYYSHFSASPDGQLLAASAEKSIDLWDIETGELVHMITENARQISFSPDGKYLAATTSLYSNYTPDKIKVWDTKNWNLVQTLQSNRVIWAPDQSFGLDEQFVCLTFSPDGSILAAGSIVGTIVLWGTNDWKKIQTLSGPWGEVTAIVFSPDGKNLVNTSVTGKFSDLPEETILTIWETTQWAITNSLSGLTTRDYLHNHVSKISFSTNGDYVITEDIGYDITYWDIPNLSKIASLPDFSWSASGASFSPDGSKLLSGDALWDTITGEKIRDYPACNPEFMSPDGKVLFSSYHPLNPRVLVKKITFCDTYSGEILHSLEIPDYANSLKFSPDGQLFAAGLRNSTAVLWDTNTWEVLYTLTGHSDRVRAVAFSPDGKTLATGSDDTTIRLWNVESGEYIITLKGLTLGAYDVSFSPDGSFLIGGGYDGRNAVGKYIVFDVVNQKALLEITDAFGYQFSGNGNILGFKIINKEDWLNYYWRYYDTSDWTEIKNVNPRDFEFVLPDGKTTMSSEGGTIVIWPFQN